MQPKTNTTYVTKEENEDLWPKIKVLGQGGNLVIIQNADSGAEGTIPLAHFESNYEEISPATLPDSEKMGIVYDKATYALSALSALAQSAPAAVASNPNVHILNNTLQELIKITAPDVQPGIDELKPTITMTKEPTAVVQSGEFAQVEAAL